MYKDRGIIKWAPFDALVGFRDLINEMQYERGKKEQPILSEDQLIEMDLIIKKAINTNKEIIIYYYNDGYIKNVYGYVKKVCNIYNILYLTNNIDINLKNITKINVINN